jgi:Tfp pilus assembly protein PilO
MMSDAEDQKPAIPQSLRVPLVVDLVVILALAAQWGSNSQRMDQFERQIAELKQGQITEGRIVRIEEQQKYLVRTAEETNQLLRQYLEEQRQERKR